MKKPRILVAGLGSIGRRHLRNLLALGIDDLILLRTKVEPVPEDPSLPVVTNLEEALDCKPDAVIVCNPTAHHLDVALPAAKAGCHLFIEKPLSQNWDSVELLLCEVAKQKSIACVGFDLRFDPGLVKVREILASGVLGRITAIQAQVGQYLPDWHPWEDYRRSVSARKETGGGVILDLIHEIDYVLWLMGDVREVSCMLGQVSQLEIETEDTAAILLRFSNGAIGTISLDYVQRILSRSCRLIGNGGSLIWDLPSQKVSWFIAGQEGWHEYSYAGFARNDRFLAEMEHFLACLRGEAKPQVDLDEGCRSLKIALAAKQSDALRRSLSIE